MSTCEVCGKDMGELLTCPYCDYVPVDDEQECCQDCGKLLYDDMKGYDDVCSAPYVTASGDLFCIPCGRRIDEAEEDLQDEEAKEWGWWDYRGWIDIVEGEEGGTYIGPDNDAIGGGMHGHEDHLHERSQR